MAKVGFWLRGARGKLAGSVLMKGEKGTVARENVAPKNPKTRSQAVQRAVFATISKTAAAIDPVIRSSFDGFANGKQSRREFVRVNNALLRNAYETGVAYLLPKGSPLNAPNALKISSGKLGVIPGSTPTNIGTHGNMLKILPNNGSGEHGDWTLQDLQEMFPYIKPGSQLTFVLCVGDDTMESYKWRYARIVLGTWLKATDVVISAGDMCINASAIDTSKTEGFVVTSHGDVSLDDPNAIITVVSDDQETPDYHFVFGNPGYDIIALAGGLIISNYDEDKGTWVHTESTMGLVPDILWEGNDAVSIPSYMAAARTVSDSTYYTEQADVDTTPVYYNYNEAIQVVCQAYGYASKQFTFGSNNSYGPVAEGEELTIMLIPNTGVNIDAGQIRLLLGEQSVIPQITSTARGTKILKFEVPFGTAQSVTANLTFGGTWNSGVSYDNAAIRATISKVQG
jgi:hypothetical protein